MVSDQQLIEAGQALVRKELSAVESLLQRINTPFAEACRLILDCRGRVVVTGMGKSGHIGRKIAASLASTGTPSFYVHPAEASHGDMGMITSDDTVIAISSSGSSAEILAILPLIKRKSVKLIAMTGQPESTLAKEADVILDIHVKEEACPLGLAPTSSTTVTLVMGDALVVSLLEARGFTAEDFAFSHPGGALGKKLLLRVDDIMHTGNAMPLVKTGTNLSDALLEMSAKGLGMTGVTDEHGYLIGLFTDGDLRRFFEKSTDIRSTKINDVMTHDSLTIQSGMLAAETLAIMEEKNIYRMFVVDDKGIPAGAIHVHDLLKAGII